MKKLPILSLFILVLIVQNVFAISIGVSPGRVEFEQMIQDGYAERTVTVSTNTNDILKGHFDVRGDAAEWLRFDPPLQEFNVTRANPYKLTIIAEPPVDIPNGNYSTQIDFITDEISSIDGRAGGIIKAAVTLLMNSEISGEEIISCRAGAFRFADTEPDLPLEFGSTVINDGNVRIRPTISFEIYDQNQEVVVLQDEVFSDEVLPTTEEVLVERLSHGLDLGQYWVEMEVEECEVNDLITFEVVERGQIVDQGLLLGVFNPPDADVGDTVQFTATFQNKGPRSVLAKFKGDVTIDDTIVKVIETEEILVDSGRTQDFEIFFTPEEEGNFVLNGRVLYNKKITFEKGSSLRVGSVEGEEKQSIIPLAIYLVIIITIIFILRKIIKERKRRF